MFVPSFAYILSCKTQKLETLDVCCVSVEQDNVMGCFESPLFKILNRHHYTSMSFNLIV